VDGPRPFLVMEYVAGGSLADRLRDPDARPWDPQVLARELLDALGYIHDARVIHRDIKPANVLIGSDGRARLTDFGIAQPSDATRLTKTGMVVGSGRFIAPEVMRGAPASKRSDLYSLRVLIDECRGTRATPRMRALVRELTAEQPERRPASAHDALKTLEHDPTALERDPTDSTRVMDDATGATVPQMTRYGGRPQLPQLPKIPQIPEISRIGAREATVALIVLLALLLIALIGLATSGGGSGASASGPTRANANAPLSSQLSQLDGAIDKSRR
jgi:eukaryotic-like serine/threonine-protein kinase